MRLADVLRREHIMLDLKSRAKNDLLGEMITFLCEKVEGLDRDTAYAALLKREELGTTGIGHGVAIPHGKLKGVDKVIVCFGRSVAGVEFDSMDAEPVHLFFLIVAPENSAAAHLKLLASISRLLKSNEFRTKLMSLDNPTDIFRLIMESDTPYGYH
ncbi:MAG: PTS sugar transporter subunit IIA [Proteobacteria bacterium]|nr:PTS sugar transporter subunit IIA [Pseudomonadota bacterium]